MNHNIEGYYNRTPSYKSNCNCYKSCYNYIILKNKKIITGIKWECVEFVRRYLSITYNITFDFIENVYDILNLKYFVDFYKIKPIFFDLYKKSPNFLPKIDDLVLFYYKNTGHIAIVSKIRDSKYIEICEQNWEKPWENIKYSRVINVKDPKIIAFLRFL